MGEKQKPKEQVEAFQKSAGYKNEVALNNAYTHAWIYVTKTDVFDKLPFPLKQKVKKQVFELFESKRKEFVDKAKAILEKKEVSRSFVVLFERVVNNSIGITDYNLQGRIYFEIMHSFFEESKKVPEIANLSVGTTGRNLVLTNELKFKK